MLEGIPVESLPDRMQPRRYIGDAHLEWDTEPEDTGTSRNQSRDTSPEGSPERQSKATLLMMLREGLLKGGNQERQPLIKRAIKLHHQNSIFKLRQEKSSEHQEVL